MQTGADLIRDMNDCAVPEGACAFWWLGQHSFTVKLGHTLCWIDPFLTPSERRNVPPLVKPEEVTNASVILGSHDHGDHIDRGAWPAIAEASPQATFVVPDLLRERIVDELKLAPERVLGIDQGVTQEIAGLEISGVPAAHEFLDVDEATGKHPYVGFVVEGDGFCLYHSGDSCIYEGMQALLRQWKIDLAFLPINGRDAKRLASHCIGNMTYQEAADLAGSVRPGTTVPAHYEMFPNNSQDPGPFIDYMRVKYPDLRTVVPEHGERVLVAKGVSEVTE